MAKRTNYKQEKRLKELEKKQRRDAKNAQKSNRTKPSEDNLEDNDIVEISSDGKQELA